MSKGLFITGTGTNVGKSYSIGFMLSVFNQLPKKFLSIPPFKTLYYKPIQCGLPSDADFMRKIIKHKHVASSFNLKTPSSPHFAFAKEGVKFDIKVVKKVLTQAKKDYDFIFMEGAGGVRTPITDKFNMADLAKMSGFPTLIVAKPSLGAINSTLLTIDYLKSKNVEIRGFIFSWEKGVNPAGEMILDNAKTIERLSGVKFEGEVPRVSFSEKKSS